MKIINQRKFRSDAIEIAILMHQSIYFVIMNLPSDVSCDVLDRCQTLEQMQAAVHSHLSQQMNAPSDCEQITIMK